MRMSSTMLCLPLLVVTVRGCCTPLQWEMDGGKVAATLGGDRFNLALTNSKVHYDAINARVAMTMGIFRDPNFKNTTIWDYQQRLMYEIDNIRGTCDVVLLETPFEQMCTPEDAGPPSTFFYGGGDQGRLPAQMFEYTRPSYSGFVKVTAGEPTTTCVPIISVDYDLHFMTFMTFENIENGIRDPSVFIPPTVCQGFQPRKMDGRFRKHPYLRVPMATRQQIKA